MPANYTNTTWGNWGNPYATSSLTNPWANPSNFVNTGTVSAPVSNSVLGASTVRPENAGPVSYLNQPPAAPAAPPAAPAAPPAAPALPAVPTAPAVPAIAEMKNTIGTQAQAQTNTLEEQQAAQTQNLEDYYAPIFSFLDEQLTGANNYYNQTTVPGINSLYGTNASALEAGKAGAETTATGQTNMNLADIAQNAQGLLRGASHYLGAMGASDSSGVEAMGEGITRSVNQENAKQLSGLQQIIGNLEGVYTTNKANLDNWKALALTSASGDLQTKIGEINADKTQTEQWKAAAKMDLTTAYFQNLLQIDQWKAESQNALDQWAMQRQAGLEDYATQLSMANQYSTTSSTPVNLQTLATNQGYVTYNPQTGATNPLYLAGNDVSYQSGGQPIWLQPKQTAQENWGTPYSGGDGYQYQKNLSTGEIRRVG